MQYLKKITMYEQPTKADTLAYNTLWIRPQDNGFNEIFIQKNKNSHKPKWELLGYEIATEIEGFWKDEDLFIKQAQYLLDLDDDEVENLKERMPHTH